MPKKIDDYAESLRPERCHRIYVSRKEDSSGLRIILMNQYKYSRSTLKCQRKTRITTSSNGIRNIRRNRKTTNSRKQK